MEIDFRHMIRVVLRRAWLVALVAVLAGVAAYILISTQPAQYAATAQVLVNPVQSAGTPDFNEIQASRAQAQTYRLLATSAPVLDRTIEALGLEYDRDELSENVTATVIPETQIIEIRVEDSSADGAAEIANAIGEQFVAYVGGMKVSRLEEQRSQLQDEASSLQTRRQELAKQIADLDTEANTSNGEAQAQLAELKDEQFRADETLADLAASIRTLNRDIATSTTPIEVSDPAEVPDQPFAPRVMFTTVLGLFLGLLLGVGLAAVLEFLDTTIRADSNIPALTGAPLLASIGEATASSDGLGRLFALGPSGTQPTEAIRLLRTNLDFAGLLAPARTIAVSAPDDDAGASTVAANLGIAVAQAGRRTLIIDADLRRPAQHLLFGVENREGIADLLAGEGNDWARFAQSTQVGGLRVLTSGSPPENPADVLGSRRFAEVLAGIAAEVDAVIIDTPPLLGVSDALEVTAHADGVVLVMRPGVTKRERLEAAALALHNGGIRLLGVVANRVKQAEIGQLGSMWRPIEQEEILPIESGIATTGQAGTAR